MIKLPSLGPAAGATGSSNAGGSNGAKAGAGGAYMPQSVQATSWQAQGKSGLDAVEKTQPKFRSAVIHCEVKLAEALSKSSRGKRDGLDPERSKRPDAVRTAVCMQMLSELCDMSGPFAALLGRVRDELAVSIYSDYYTTEDGSMKYDQTPYFMVVGQLEKEKEQMLREREQFRQELLSRAEDINTIEERMQALEAAVRNEKSRNNALLGEVDEAKDALERSRAEGKQTKDEIKRLRREYMSLEEDLATLQKGQGGAPELDEFNRVKRMSKELEGEISHLMAEIEELKKENMAMIDVEAYEELQDELDKTTEEVKALRDIVGVQQAAAGNSDGEPVVVTPRPDWQTFQSSIPELNLSDTSSRDIAKHLKERLGKYEFWKANEEPPRLQYKEAAYLMLPDPDPTALADLQPIFDVVDTLPKREVDEGEDPDGPEEPEGAKCKPLGTAAEVPRYLRYAEPLQVRILSKEDTVAFVRATMTAKGEAEATWQRPRLLYEFLYEYLEGQTETHAELAAKAYNTVMSLRRYSYHPEVKLFLRMLQGLLPEDVYHDRVRMEEGLLVLLRAADAHKNNGTSHDVTTTGMLSMDDTVKVLNHYFPEKADHEQVAVHQALYESVGEEAAAVDYLSLFTDDKVAGQLLTKLRSQHVNEIVDYTDRLEAFLLGLAELEARTRRATEQAMLDAMPVDAIQKALGTFDEDKAPAEFDLVVKRGAGYAELRDVPVAVQRGRTVNLPVFLTRLKSQLLKRSNNYDELAVLNYKLQGAASNAAQPPLA